MKRVSLLIGVLALALLVAACSPTYPEGDCRNLDRQAAVDNCYLEAKECSKITSKTVKNSCLAQNAQSLSACDAIEAQEAKGFCQYRFFEESKDVAICEGIESLKWQETCYYDAAQHKQDHVLCQEISSTGYRQDCIIDVAKAVDDPQVCSDLGDKRRDECYAYFAYQRNDETLCALLSTPFNQDVCIYKVARDTNTANLCQQIGMKAIRDDCAVSFAKQ